MRWCFSSLNNESNHCGQWNFFWQNDNCGDFIAETSILNYFSTFFQLRVVLSEFQIAVCMLSSRWPLLLKPLTNMYLVQRHRYQIIFINAWNETYKSQKLFPPLTSIFTAVTKVHYYFFQMNFFFSFSIVVVHFITYVLGSLVWPESDIAPSETLSETLLWGRWWL